jgi:DNA anti-recombination protein RmuC
VNVLEQVKIAQVAKTLGVSLNSVYRKVKQSEEKLNGHILKENGVTYVTAEGVEILRGLFAKLNPGETVDNKEDTATNCLREIIANQQKTLDALIAQHAEERARQAEERARADAIIMKLTQDVGKMQKMLEERKPEPAPQNTFADVKPEVKPWEPKKVPSPLANKPWYQKLWVEIFEPWKMRQQPY